ncbi:MAG: GNAT family N-acetyltransferase [Treponema sp.]|nr:GNAT family N-acetyltransferase [Treponema sp.]
MQTVFEMAQAKDRDEVLGFANYVFSNDYDTRDFGPMLPKIFRHENFMDGMHYLARVGGKIKAMAGAYPLEMQVANGKGGVVSLPGRSIGMVCTHPDARGRGLMAALMETVMSEMVRDGIVFSCLSEDQHHYAQFGFAPANSVYTFRCGKGNIERVLGHEWKTGLSLVKVGAGDGALLDDISVMHEAKPVRMKRERAKLFDILSSWKSQVYAVTEDGHFEGYIVQLKGTITEMNLRRASPAVSFNLHALPW